MQHNMTDSQELKLNDPDRYLLSLFEGNIKHRAALVTVDMLNLEIARLRDVIETPHMGFIRLQWWRDEIRKIYAGQKVASHPVLISLSEIIPAFKLAYDDFDKLIAGREADFEEYDAFDISAYARGIHIPLLKIKAAIVGEGADVAPLGTAYSLVGLLRAIPFYRARSQVLIPSIQPDAVQKICNEVGALLAQDKTTNRYFRANHVLARLYLNQLKKTGYNPEKLTPLAFKELRVWWGV